jgi:hypothetical protein
MVNSFRFAAVIESTCILISTAAAAANVEFEVSASLSHRNVGSRNWTQFYCDDVLIADGLYYTPPEQWNGLNADEAWKDVMRIWKETDRHSYEISFSQSVSNTLKIGIQPDCGTLFRESNCNVAQECGRSMDTKESGPAGQLIWNSLVNIHQTYSSYDRIMFKAQRAPVLGTSKTRQDFGDLVVETFASTVLEPAHDWDQWLTDVLTIGTYSTAGPFFNTWLRQEPYFSTKEGGTSDYAKDIAFALVDQSLSIVKNAWSLNDDQKWTPGLHSNLSSYMGDLVNGWRNLTSASLTRLFDGSDSSIELLSKTISGGKLVSGMCDTATCSGDRMGEQGLISVLQANSAKILHALAIPAIWDFSKAHAFIIDAGYDCDANEPLSRYLTSDTMKATSACVDGKLYYIVSPVGKANIQKLTAPKGLEYLDGKDFGGITKEDLIKGSVRTYIENGGKNGGKADLDNRDTLEGLLKVDVTTPGVIRLPMCSPERALQNWEKSDKTVEHYPCNVS